MSGPPQQASPSEPAWANQLVQGAWRVTAEGEELGDRTVERDAAFIEYGLACGARRHTLYWATIHELPPPRVSGLNVVNIPDMITKNDAGGAALAFEPRLRRVRAYVNGARNDLCQLTSRHFDPERRMTLLKANQQRRLIVCRLLPAFNGSVTPSRSARPRRDG